MEWSPHNAIEAYLQTLHLCKVNKIESASKRLLDDENQKQDHIEPQGLELISALAAGNQAKVIIHVTTSKQGTITPLTLALDVATKQTNGKLICILPDQHHVPEDCRDCSSRKITDVAEFRVGDPCEQIKNIRDVDFVVIDYGFDSKFLKLFFEKIDLNPKGTIIVANNIVRREEGVAFVDQVLNGKRGVESSITTIPLGSTRVQVIIRIKTVIGKPQRRRHKRFLVTFDG